MLKFSEIGIDLGVYEIKIAEVDKVNLIDNVDSDLNHLKSYKSYSVDCEAYSEEYFKLLRKSIKDFAKTFKKRSLSLNFSLPINKYTNTLFLNVPSVSKKDLEDGIKFEAEQVLALEEIKDVQFTWKAINEYPELNEYEILLATISSNIVKSLAHFKTISWKINRVMLQPVLLERFSKGNDIIVDFGHANTRIYMYKEGKLSEVDSVKISGFTIEKKIEEYLEFNNIEGEDDFGEELNAKNLIKKSYVENDLIDEEDEMLKEIAEVIKSPLTKLIDEIKRIIRSFELSSSVNIDNVYYVGELSNLKYFMETLEAELDLPVTPLNIIAKDIEDIKYDLAGLSMMDAKLKDDTNFTKFIKANIDYTSILIAILAISLSTGIALKMMDTKYETIISVQSREESQQRVTIDGLQNDISSAQHSIDESQSFITKIEMLRAEKRWLSDILYVIPDVTPTTVVIKDLNIVDKEVKIKGYGADYSAVGFLSAELEKIGEVEIETLTDYTHTDGEVFSVVTDEPENISNKFLMTKNFSMTLKYQGELLNH